MNHKIVFCILSLTAPAFGLDLGRFDEELKCDGEENTEFQSCKTCEGTCADPIPNCDWEPCLPAGCQCRPAFLRHNGTCILPEQCPAFYGLFPCGTNEKLSCVSEGCMPDCENPDISCPEVCSYDDCVCKGGYLKHNGICIPVNDCPVKENTESNNK